MRLRRWYLIMLLLPLVLPVAAFITVSITGYDAMMEGMETFLRFLIVCSMIAGIPYFFFALCVLWWCRNKTPEQIKKASWWLPWPFMLLCGLFFLVGFTLHYPEGDAMQAALTMAAICVPVGFLYVAMVHIFTKIARSIKFITE